MTIFLSSSSHIKTCSIWRSHVLEAFTWPDFSIPVSLVASQKNNRVVEGWWRPCYVPRSLWPATQVFLKINYHWTVYSKVPLQKGNPAKRQLKFALSTITKIYSCWSGVELCLLWLDCNNDGILLQSMLFITAVCRIPIASLGGAAIHFEHKDLVPGFSDIDCISKSNKCLIWYVCP